MHVVNLQQDLQHGCRALPVSLEMGRDKFILLLLALVNSQTFDMLPVSIGKFCDRNFNFIFLGRFENDVSFFNTLQHAGRFKLAALVGPLAFRFRKLSE